MNKNLQTLTHVGIVAMAALFLPSSITTTADDHMDLAPRDGLWMTQRFHGSMRDGIEIGCSPRFGGAGADSWVRTFQWTVSALNVDGSPAAITQFELRFESKTITDAALRLKDPFGTTIAYGHGGPVRADGQFPPGVYTIVLAACWVTVGTFEVQAAARYGSA